MTGSAAANPLLDAALAYAAKGWRVVPLHTQRSDGGCTCGKGRNCPKPGKHPRIKEWPERATTEGAVIREWWRRWSSANVGIATGAESGIFATDHDGEDGLSVLRALELEHGELPPVPTNLTGGGGMHHIFTHPGGRVQNTSDEEAEGAPFHVRGDGGLIVAPPSLHASGRSYVWEVTADPLVGTDPAPAPAWLLALIADNGSDGAKAAQARRKRAAAPIPETIRETSRNTTLASLAGSLRQRGANEGAIREALLAVNRQQCVPPLSDKEVADIAGSVARYEPGDSLRLTELGLAERFRDEHQAKVRWCGDMGKWLTWTGTRWTTDETGEVLRLAKRTVLDLYHILPVLPDDKAREAMRKFIAAHERERALRSVLALAQSELPLPARYTDFDADGWVLNTLNGILDLRTGILRSHAPEALCMKQVPVSYDPTAQCPLWIAFLERAMGGDQALVSFLQLAAGASLPAHTLEQVLPIVYGPGSNGKSTFTETLLRMCGDYGHTCEPQTLLTKRHDDGIRNDLAALAGRRLVVTSELPQGRQLDAALVKKLTGSDTITARFLFREHFSFRPSFRIWLSTNHRPRMRETTHAAWRRIRLVPFSVVIPDDEQDKALPAKLVEELPGILSWAVAGCLAWQSEGRLSTPEAIAEATAAYREEEDTLGQFIGTCCVTGPQVWTTAEALRDAYVDFCASEREQALSATAFGRALTERGFELSRETIGGKTTRVRRGIGLASS